jgi:hypothetical protein
MHVVLELRFILKLWENLRCYFEVCGLISIFPASRKVQDCVMEEERV